MLQGSKRSNLHSDQLAVELFRKAGEQGNCEALFNLGYCYRNGRGVEKDKKEVKKKEGLILYEKAAKMGHERAEEELERLKPPSRPSALQIGRRKSSITPILQERFKELNAIKLQNILDLICEYEVNSEGNSISPVNSLVLYSQNSIPFSSEEKIKSKSRNWSTAILKRLRKRRIAFTSVTSTVSIDSSRSSTSGPSSVDTLHGSSGSLPPESPSSPVQGPRKGNKIIKQFRNFLPSRLNRRSKNGIGTQ